MNIFNYLSELKKDLHLPDTIFTSYNIINISGNLLYIEGHNGLISISTETIIFKIKKGKIEVNGKNLFLKILSENTLAIQGKIYKIEVF